MVEICARHGISKVVLSPGSRNAPLIISFNNHPDFECYCIPDERVAAFVAMGMAQHSEQPVIIACTSGTSTLNYAPAIAEAYYQRIPLLVLTADRPIEWIDQGDGQTIRQHDIYHNYILKSFEFPQEPNDPETLSKARQLVNEAINHATTNRGPVHINMHFTEPLYGKADRRSEEVEVVIAEANTPQLPAHELAELASKWNAASNVLFLAGKMDPDEALNQQLAQFAAGKAVVLTESTSNLHAPPFIESIDRTIFAIEKEAPETYRPDLLITIGGAVISKKIKALLRRYAPKDHWHINPYGDFPNTYKVLNKGLKTTALNFLQQLDGLADRGAPNAFTEAWKQLSAQAKSRHDAFATTAPWSDWYVFDRIKAHLPANGDLHLSNSTPVRYVQLFDQDGQHRHFANRGTSGIDGCTSTALGSALATRRPTTLITGDIAFFYDSNAFWHPHVPDHLKIILIHNSGGGIFRIIDGPSSTKSLVPFFEARHQTSSKPVAEMHGLEWQGCHNKEGLEKGLKWLFGTQKAAILEVQTPPEVNDVVLKRYIQAILGGQ